MILELTDNTKQFKIIKCKSIVSKESFWIYIGIIPNALATRFKSKFIDQQYWNKIFKDAGANIHQSPRGGWYLCCPSDSATSAYLLKNLINKIFSYCYTFG